MCSPGRRPGTSCSASRRSRIKSGTARYGPYVGRATPLKYCPRAGRVAVTLVRNWGAARGSWVSRGVNLWGVPRKIVALISDERGRVRGPKIHALLTHVHEDMADILGFDIAISDLRIWPGCTWDIGCISSVRPRSCGRGHSLLRCRSSRPCPSRRSGSPPARWCA